MIIWYSCLALQNVFKKGFLFFKYASINNRSALEMECILNKLCLYCHLQQKKCIL